MHRKGMLQTHAQLPVRKMLTCICVCAMSHIASCICRVSGASNLTRAFSVGKNKTEIQRKYCPLEHYILSAQDIAKSGHQSKRRHSQGPKDQALNHCVAEMLPLLLISACSCGSTRSGSKPSISATRPAVLGSILPYVMKIACTHARPSDPTGHGLSLPRHGHCPTSAHHTAKAPIETESSLLYPMLSSVPFMVN
jgi:hypothetical protein